MADHTNDSPGSGSGRSRALIGTLVIFLAGLSVGAAFSGWRLHQRRPAPTGPAPVVPSPVEALPASAPAPEGAVPSSTSGMVWIPAGEFTLGSERGEAWPAERPSYRYRSPGFWIDRTEVTNAAFARFVEATGYVTIAERPVEWEAIRAQLPPGTPRPPEENLRAGSLVFHPTDGPVPTDDVGRWWRWTVGASWRHPEGPGSSLEGRWDHPVVHVAWDDAAAYASWAGKRLPTEVEWEVAARGGLDDARFSWGNEPPTDELGRVNIWQGEFPFRNTEADGFLRTAPVASFAPNGYGLHDMAGNVWEWCADWYRADANARRRAGAGPDGIVTDPGVPDTWWNPNRPTEPQRLMKGGSYLCHASYCSSYRPSARMGTTPDTSLGHVGFRCVSDAPAPAR